MAALATATPAAAQTTIRIVPTDGAVFARGQRFDLRVEATGADPGGAPPRGLRVEVDGEPVTALNILDPGAGGERGAGGTGASGAAIPPHQRAGRAPGQHTSPDAAADDGPDARDEEGCRTRHRPDGAARGAGDGRPFGQLAGDLHVAQPGVGVAGGLLLRAAANAARARSNGRL
ncbi:MAG: hypothetical protein KY453_04775 [Gemmatimonadetes bacterium]|nr:hypothetical protein [Gemmatimonadota bacterium]